MQDIQFKQDMERPWWWYKVFADNEMCTTKIHFINPWSMFSLQSHQKREEMWYIISGKARVYRGPVKDNLEEIKKSLKTYDLEAWENILIQKYTVHSIENIGQEQAQILEIMRGEWDEEGDIIRYEDKYGRV
jgi:mannose-6-phosphate isomerase-like protein (cupin superfamily)